MSTPTQRISHPVDFSCLINQPIPVHALQEALVAEDDEMKPESHSLFAQVVLIEIIYKHIFSSLDIGSLARLGTVCKEFRILGNGYVLCLLKSYSLMKIVDNYGFEPASDLRNLVIVQKAYEACLSEGLEEDLSFSTLPKRIAVAEDRNLIKLFLRYMNTIFAGRTVTYLKNNPEEAEFLRQHPELNVCCISQVEDIPGAANTIRAWLNNRQLIQMNVLYLGKLPSTHNVHMCIVPPEIVHFRLNILLANKNAFTLISRNVGAAIQGTVDLRYNQLGALPDELGSANTQSAYATEGNPNDMLPPKGSPRTKLINRSALTFHALGAKLQMVMLPEAVKISKGRSCGS